MRNNRKLELYGNGIINMTDVSDGYRLNERQRLQIESLRNGQPYIDTLFSFDEKDGITSMINKYRRGTSEAKEDNRAQKLEKMLNETRELITCVNLQAVVSPAENNPGYDVPKVIFTDQ